MSAILSQRCLELNKNRTAMGTLTVQDAIIKLTSTYDDGTPKAKVICPETMEAFTWSDWASLSEIMTNGDDLLHSSHAYYKVPEVIVLTRYEKVRRPKLHFSRRNIFKRDKMTCQYCGDQPGSEELNIDHVVPRAQGGITSWENCVLSCVDCNRRKRDRTPHQANMVLLSKPKKPDTGNIFKFDLGNRPLKSWKAFISEAYWNVELED